MAIEHFRGENYFLSSMYPIEPPGGIEVIEGLVVPTSEHPYQAAKFVAVEARAKILASPNGFAAKSVADTYERSGVQVRDGWDNIKVAVMRACVALKFGQNSNLAERLVDSGHEELVEGHRGNKYSFWGVAPIGSRNGLNWLGRILMDTRKLLLEQDDQDELHPERLLHETEAMALSGVSVSPTEYMTALFSGA